MPKGIRIERTEPRNIPLSQSVLYRELKKTPIADTPEKRKQLLVELHSAFEGNRDAVSKGIISGVSRKYPNQQAKNLNEALVWRSTPQGQNFWEELHHDSGLRRNS